MDSKNIFVAVCVFFVFINLALLGFTTVFDLGISQILFVANIFLLSCVFYTSLEHKGKSK